MVLFSVRRSFSTSLRTAVKVALLGSSGGIGQPLALLLRMNPLVTELSLYDLIHTPGVAADLSHIDRCSTTISFQGREQLKGALTGSDVIVMSSGVTAVPGMTRDDLFIMNASVVRDLVDEIARNCPRAIIAIITNPVNSCVPIAAETLKQWGVYDPRKLFGVTTLDLIRTSKFIGNLKGIDPAILRIPVICGHSEETIIPLISQCKPKVKLTESEIVSLTKRIQDAGTVVLNLKAGAGTATLSMAYAGSRMVDSIMRAMNGESNVVECSFVAYNYNEVDYFSTPILLGVNGIERILGIPQLSKFETELVKIAIPLLKRSIMKGKDFMLQS